jgi:hypothetical protein
MGQWLSFNELLRLYGGDRKLVDPIWNACIADPRRHQWSPYEFAVLQIWYDLPDPRKLSDVKSMLQLIETDPEVQGEEEHSCDPLPAPVLRRCQQLEACARFQWFCDRCGQSVVLCADDTHCPSCNW